MNYQPFLRQVEVKIGAIPEWRGGKPTKQDITIYSDGSQDTLRVKFSIHKHVISTASPTVISIYNLSEKLRNNLRASESQIIINVGWQNKGMATIFTGSLLNSVHLREGADIVTNIMSLSGFGGLSRSVVVESFENGTTIREVIETYASKLPGVKVDPKLIKITDAKIGSQGLSFYGNVGDGLDRLARVYGFSWTINNGYFQAVDDEDQLDGGLVLISSKNGSLLRAEPMLASPMQVQAGVTIQSILNPAIEPGRTVKLESGVNEKLNGIYKVHTLSHTGDTQGPEWTSNIESWVVL